MVRVLSSPPLLGFPSLPPSFLHTYLSTVLHDHFQSTSKAYAHPTATPMLPEPPPTCPFSSSCEICLCLSTKFCLFRKKHLYSTTTTRWVTSLMPTKQRVPPLLLLETGIFSWVSRIFIQWGLFSNNQIIVFDFDTTFVSSLLRPSESTPRSTWRAIGQK